MKLEIDLNVYLHGDHRETAPPWATALHDMLSHIATTQTRNQEATMAALDDQLATLTAALSGIGTAVDTMAPEVIKIGTETTATLAALTALQNNPPTGITPAQQATLDAAVTSAQTILASVSNLSTSLKTVDDLVPDAA